MIRERFRTAMLGASALVTIAQLSQHNHDIVNPPEAKREARRQAEWREHCRICSKLDIDPHSPNAAAAVKAFLYGVDYSPIEARVMTHYEGKRGPLHGIW